MINTESLTQGSVRNNSMVLVHLDDFENEKQLYLV